MSKVIRTARISEHPVVLPIHANPGLVDLPEEGSEEAEATTGFTPLGEQVEVVDEDDSPPEEEQDMLVGAEDVPPIEPGFSQEEVDAIVAEKLKAAETRFQQEKKQAHQAGIAEGHAKGLEEGYQNGLGAGQTESHQEIVRFQKMLTLLAENWANVFKIADINITQIAMAVARNLVGAEIDVHSNLVIDAVRDCLKHLPDKSRITIRVHPDDLELVRTHRSVWRETYEQIGTLSVEADPFISHGGCLIETPSGDIDAQIESRLEKLKTVLIEAIRSAESEIAPEIHVSETDLTEPDPAETDLTETDSETPQTESPPPTKGDTP